jgi:tetratricopeptide (TPR) repeat protein
LQLKSKKNKMKKSLALMLVLISFISGYSQNKNTEAIQFEKQILKSAQNIGDPSVAINSMYRLIALEGENSTYKDTLAYIYFEARQNSQSYMMAAEVLKRDPNNINMIEIQGVSLQSLGAYTKAVEIYKELFSKTKNNYHGYNLANLEFTLKKYDDALKTIEEAEKLNDTGSYKVTFLINQTHEQNVDLLAAISYLKGLIAIELKNVDLAKTSLTKAVTIQPDFVLAKEKLDGLN